MINKMKEIWDGFPLPFKGVLLFTVVLVTVAVATA